MVLWFGRLTDGARTAERLAGWTTQLRVGRQVGFLNSPPSEEVLSGSQVFLGVTFALWCEFKVARVGVDYAQNAFRGWQAVGFLHKKGSLAGLRGSLTIWLDAQLESRKRFRLEEAIRQ